MATTVSWNAQRIQSFPQTGFLETSPVDQTIVGQATENATLQAPRRITSRIGGHSLRTASGRSIVRISLELLE
jgi:hypothetical protein